MGNENAPIVDGDACRSFARLVELIARLRDPETGCPWDRAQDHDSLRPYLLEEAYEAILAIEGGSPDDLADELGDVLLQVMLHSRIAAEAGEFAISDVIDILSDKLVRRHPHVFSDEDAEKGILEIRTAWHEIKRGEEGRKRSSHLPALLRARKHFDEDPELPREDPAGLSAEECAGLQLLRSVRACWEAGFDAELALQRALSALEHAGSDRNAP